MTFDLYFQSMTKHTLTIILLMFASYLFAQNSDLIFSSASVAEIRISIDTTALNWVYANTESDSLHLCSISFQNDNLDVAMDSVGFRLRGNTSRNGYKKPFKLDMNEFVKGQDICGVEKLNLRAEANDPSMIRSKLCAELMEKIGIPTSRVNYSRVYINDNYMGLYEIIEHVDENFLSYHYNNNEGNLWKCTWPADLNYRGPDPESYHPYSGPERPYELKTNELDYDFSELAHMIDVINNSSSIDSIESVIRITDVIKYLAVNIMTGSWDDYRYLRNNYYVYHDPGIDQFRFIPYDYDNTFGIDWVEGGEWGSPNWTRINMYSYICMDDEGRPLSELIFNNNEYRNLFTHFIDFYTNHVFREDQWQVFADSIKARIRPDVALDTYYPYSLTDFDDSYDTDYRNEHVERGLYEFMRKRRESTNDQKNWRSAPVSIYHQELHQTGRDATVNASIFHHQGISNVLLKTYSGSHSLINTHSMNQDRVPGSTRVEEFDRWSVNLDLAMNDIYYTITAYDSSGTFRTWPRSGYAEFKNEGVSDHALFINEFMASNDATIADAAGEFDDWVELYNASQNTIDLSGMFLTDKQDNLDKWDFPDGTGIDPEDYLIIWCDEDGDKPQSGLHANFKLSAGGEFLALVDTDTFSVIDHISFGPQTTDISFGRETDGGSNWIAFEHPTPGYSNLLTGIDPLVPMTTVLYPNYPNPFNPTTTLSFRLALAGDVELNIYNIRGRKMQTLYAGQKDIGVYQFNWNASHFASGVYMAALKVDGKLIATQKMLLVK